MGVTDVNNLSWLIYAANVSGNLGGTLIGLSVLCAAGALASGIGRFAPEGWSENKETCAARQASWGGFFKRFISGLIALMLALVFVPSQDTVYAIAASEVGEDVLASPTGSRAVKALDAWLDRQIAPPAPVSQ